MKEKLYFPDYMDSCCGLQQILECMEDDGLETIIVNEAINNNDIDYKWCSEYDSAIYHGDGCCGKNCKHYYPQNGKNGICCHLSKVYDYGDEYTLYQDGRLEKINKQK